MNTSNAQYKAALRWRRVARNAFWNLRSLFGSRFCPVCCKRVGAFIPFGSAYIDQWRESGFDHSVRDFETLNFNQYTCPFCGSSDRDRLCAMFARRRLDGMNRPINLIDFAPSVPLAELLKHLPLISYRSADLYMKGVDDNVDIMDLSIYRSESIDCFICSHVLEHVANDRLALRELYRVLAPGGWGIILVPISTKISGMREDPSASSSGERWKQFGQDDHVRLYTREAFLRRLEEPGFRVDQLGQDDFGVEEYQRCGIAPSSILYIVGKPETVDHGNCEIVG